MATSYLVACASLVISSIASLVVYRLFLGPLARIPGPKLAAATGLVEIYYDVVKGGQYIFKIEQWHAKYGPIIRISPNQVHILDPEYFDELYTMKQPRHNKPERLRHRFNAADGLADWPDSDEHDRRRTMIAPLFSKQRVTEFTRSIQERADKLCREMSRMKGETVILDEAWSSFAADNVLWYSLALSYDFLDYPNFSSPFTQAVSDIIFSLHVVSHFPILMTMMNAVPPAWVKTMNPKMAAVLDFQDEVRRQVRRVVFGANEEQKVMPHRIVFHELSSRLGRDEKALKAMEDDGLTITMAGIDTTGRALSVICFWVLQKRAILTRLLSELENVIPDPHNISPLHELEKLPYLSAVISEGLRLSYGVAGRLTRYNPHTTITYNDFTLPLRTEFSMSPALQHRLATTFPDPHVFDPDRWLGDPISPSSGRPLSRYLVSFTKGPRACLGMHFAYAQLYIGLATFIRNMGDSVDLAEGVHEDVVTLGAEFFAPVSKDPRGVKVVVRG